MGKFKQETTTTYLGETDKGTFIYTALATESFRIGDISHGGYIMSLLLDSAIVHFSKRHQTDPIALNCFFLNKTDPGYVVIEIEQVKMSSKGYCVIRATLKQRHDLASLLSLEQYSPVDYKPKVLGIVTMGNMDAEEGLTLYPSRLPTNDTDFESYVFPFLKDIMDFRIRRSSFCKENGNVELPFVQHIGKFCDGEQLSFEAIPFWCDMFALPPFLLSNDTLKEPVWCPTMQLEVLFKGKPSGTKIYSQFTTNYALNGRFDVVGELWNEQGQILATTSHQCLIVPWSRNSKVVQITGRESNL